jgi:hypothetical protein
MKLTKRVELRSFAAYPQCSADLTGRERGVRIRSWYFRLIASRIVIGAIVAAIPLACGGLTHRSIEWRRQQEILIAVAVLKDLTELPPDQHDPLDVRSSFCVFVGEDHTGHHEPPADVVTRLRALVPKVYPISECDMWKVKATGARAVLLGVSPVEWRNSEQVKVEGQRSMGPLAGAGWIYALSLTAEGWKIDTVKGDWIS